MPAATSRDVILLKIVLMLLATLGMMAPAATATNAAMREYSIRSWPLVCGWIRASVGQYASER